jgi:predicted NBD/HSP70 family sugar kinase
LFWYAEICDAGPLCSSRTDSSPEVELPGPIDVEHFGGRETTITLRPIGPLRTLPHAGLLREITDGTVLEQVFWHGRVTRAGVAAATGISKPTISDSFRRLVERGLLTEGGPRSGHRGRVATYYQLASTAGWVLAIAVDHEQLTARAMTVTGEPVGESTQPAPGDPRRLIGALLSVLRQHRSAAAGLGPLRVMAIAVASPFGGAAPTSGVPDWRSPAGQAGLRSLLPRLGGTRLLLESAVDLAGHAERQLGVARDASSFGYLSFGRSLDLALYVDDTLVRGAHGLAGEVGLLPHSSSPAETVQQALARQGFGTANGTALDAETIIRTLDQAAAGDVVAATRVDGMCRSLLSVVAAAYAVVDPELLVLGGPVGRHPWLLARLELAARTLQPLPVQLVSGALDGSAAVRGALLRGLAEGQQGLLRSGD